MVVFEATPCAVSHQSVKILSGTSVKISRTSLSVISGRPNRPRGLRSRYQRGWDWSPVDEGDEVMETEPSMSRTQFTSAADGGQQPQQQQQHQHQQLESKQESTSSPEIEAIENMSLTANTDTPMGNTGPPPGVGLGGASIQQPKVQTAFIHKLYKWVQLKARTEA